MSRRKQSTWSTPEFFDERSVDVSNIGNTIKSRGIKSGPIFDKRKLKASRKSLALWNPSKNRTERELQQLRNNVRTASDPEERRHALCRLKMAYMDEDDLTAARRDYNLERVYRDMAFDEYKFRTSRASLEEAQERNRNLSITTRICNSSNSGGFKGAARLVFEYIKQASNPSASGFYMWCKSLADKEIALLSSGQVLLDNKQEPQILDKLEIEVTFEDENGELIADGIIVEGLGSRGDGKSLYRQDILKRTFRRYKNTKIF